MTKRLSQKVDTAYNKSSDFSDDSDDDMVGGGGTINDQPPQSGKNNDETGPSGVRPCDSSKEPKRVYPKLPSVKLREKGAIYEVDIGVYKRWNGKNLVPMCRDCPEDAKKQAHYPDEHGNQNKLCAPCAKQDGTWTVQNPCRDCPEHAKKQANYPGEDGNQNKLCARCAKQHGTMRVRSGNHVMTVKKAIEDERMGGYFIALMTENEFQFFQKLVIKFVNV